MSLTGRSRAKCWSQIFFWTFNWLWFPSSHFFTCEGDVISSCRVNTSILLATSLVIDCVNHTLSPAFLCAIITHTPKDIFNTPQEVWHNHILFCSAMPDRAGMRQRAKYIFLLNNWWFHSEKLLCKLLPSYIPFLFGLNMAVVLLLLL